MIAVLLALNVIAAFVFGYVSNGKSPKTDNYNKISGVIYILIILVSIVLFVIKGYWIGLLWLVLIFFIVPKFGDLLIKEKLIKQGYPRDML